MTKTIEETLNCTFKSEHQKAIINLRYTTNWLANLQHNYMSKFDLSVAQFNILRILRGAKGFISVNTVKERMIEKSPNTTRLMDKLFDKKLIERVRCESDRRIVYVKISEGGLNLLATIDSTFEDSFLVAHNLTEEDAATLNTILDKLRNSQ
ncbi:MAG TPA: MarR family transcriptional regulator [Crocinitomicaceae bacterium]|nr:MarR family transcriptional regulator [Crocinitomicaceae bacterium]